MFCPWRLCDPPRCHEVLVWTSPCDPSCSAYVCFCEKQCSPPTWQWITRLWPCSFSNWLTQWFHRRTAYKIPHGKTAHKITEEKNIDEQHPLYMYLCISIYTYINWTKMNIKWMPIIFQIMVNLRILPTTTNKRVAPFCARHWLLWFSRSHLNV